MKFLNLKKMSKEEKQRVQNEKELEEFNRKQEKYNSMLREETQKQKFMNKMSTIKANTFTKKMVIIILAVCIIDMQLSYILAFFDKAQTIEGLSNQLCITILGVAFVYMVRAYFDSKAEHRNLDDSIKKDIESNIADKMNEALSAAGINNINAKDFIHEDEEISKGGLHINISKSNNDNAPKG